MSVPKTPEPAQLLVSVLTPHERIGEEVKRSLSGELGPIEEQIGPLDFPFTTYYDGEMGPGIRRWLYTMAELRDRSELAKIKLLTNEIEQSYASAGCRRCNLDPGMITLGSFVLASGKDGTHRIYLGDGIFADLTLVFRSGTFQTLPWTFPDYGDAQLIDILNRLRETYKWKLKQLRQATDW